MNKDLLKNTILFGLISLSVFGQSSKKPNIIIIMADDMGWSDIGC
jgi:hypothetical protein